jgi:hypothetical protein
MARDAEGKAGRPVLGSSVADGGSSESGDATTSSSPERSASGAQSTDPSTFTPPSLAARLTEALAEWKRAEGRFQDGLISLDTFDEANNRLAFVARHGIPELLAQLSSAQQAAGEAEAEVVIERHGRIQMMDQIRAALGVGADHAAADVAEKITRVLAELTTARAAQAALIPLAKLGRIAWGAAAMELRRDGHILPTEITGAAANIGLAVAGSLEETEMFHAARSALAGPERGKGEGK